MSAWAWRAARPRIGSPQRPACGLQRALQLWLIYCFLSGFLLGAGIA